MKYLVYLTLLIMTAYLPSCIFKIQRSNDRHSYIERVDSSGFVITGIYEYDEGFHTDVSAKYRIREKKNKSMIYDLLTPEYLHMGIYDTMSFYFDFDYPDSSNCIFSDSEYNKILKKYECSVTSIPLVFKGKLSNIQDCENCNIYKFESLYLDQCYSWYVSDSIGFLKRYAPYRNNIADYEIGFLRDSPKYNYSKKLLNAIKAKKQFHTRCSPGNLW